MYDIYLHQINLSRSQITNKLKYAHTHTQTHLIKENEPNNLNLKEYEYEIEILTCHILIILVDTSIQRKKIREHKKK